MSRPLPPLVAAAAAGTEMTGRASCEYSRGHVAVHVGQSKSRPPELKVRRLLSIVSR